MNDTKPTIPFICEECRSEFEPRFGGICAVCGRVLCSKHLVGWGISLSFRKSEKAAQLTCVKCENEKKEKNK